MPSCSTRSARSSDRASRKSEKTGAIAGRKIRTVKGSIGERVLEALPQHHPRAQDVGDAYGVDQAEGRQERERIQDRGDRLLDTRGPQDE